MRPVAIGWGESLGWGEPVETDPSEVGRDLWNGLDTNGLDTNGLDERNGRHLGDGTSCICPFRCLARF